MGRVKRVAACGALAALALPAFSVGLASADGTSSVFVARRVDVAGNPVDGLLLYDTAQQGSTEISSLGDEGEPVSWLPDGSGFVFRDEQWSADGSQVTGRIPRYDLATGATRTLIERQAYLNTPVMSPTGDLIAYTSVGQSVETRVMRVDGSGDRPVSAVVNLSSQPWSPDGRSLVGTCQRPDVCFLVVDVVTGSTRRVFPPDGAVAPSLAVWSPAGEVIALEEAAGGIILVSPDGAVVGRLPGPRWDGTDQAPEVRTHGLL